jgi:type I restriction enzyme, S subunit
MRSTAPLKRLAVIEPGQSPPSDEVSDFLDEGLPFVQGNAEFGAIHPAARLRCDTAPKRALAGDILVSVRAPVGALNIADRSLGIGRGLAAIQPRVALDQRFLWWYMHASVEALRAMGSGSTYDAVTAEDVGALLIPMIPMAQQRVIADFLDTETARIDALIARKRSLREVLRLRVAAEANALIFRAAAVQPVRRWATAFKTGGTPPASEMERLMGDDIPWLSPGDLGEMLLIRSAARRLSASATSEGWCPTFPANSTLVVGIGATAGRVGHLTEPASGNQQMTCIVSGPEMLPRYLSWQLWARQDELRATAPYTTLPIITNEFLRDFKVVSPTLWEQRNTVSRLDDLATSTERLSSKLGSQLAMLLERRQALITAAVTGELDLPDVAG